MNRFSLHILYIFYGASILFLVSCKSLDDEEPIPAYIRIPAIVLQTPADNSQGSNSSKITEVWVYVDDNLQGVYPLPAKFPILNLGTKKITIRAGVYENGISSTRIDYPFYNSFDTTVTLNAGATVLINPIIRGYKSGANFRWQENFDGIGISLQKTNNSGNDVSITNDASSIFEGVASGKFIIIPNSYNVEIANTDLIFLPKQGINVFLEMDYSVNQDLAIGLFAQNTVSVSQVSAITVRPTVDGEGNRIWKKIYINLTNQVSQNTFATGYKVYFSAKEDTVTNNPSFLIDNLKLVSF